MAAVNVSAENKPFELSRVGALTFDLIRREFVTVYGFAVAIAAVPAVLSYFAGRDYTLALQAQLQPHGAVAAHWSQILPQLLLAYLLSLLATLLIYAVLSWGAVEQLQGRNPTIGERLSAALRALPVLAGVVILGYLAIFFASILLLIPGLILMTMWTLVAPAAVCEKIGVFATFGRSSELTHGHRWSIFLLLLIFWLGSAAIGLLALVLGHGISGASGPWYGSNFTGLAGYIAIAVNILIGGLYHVVAGVGVGVAYHELRRAEGSFDSRSLADVFA